MPSRRWLVWPDISYVRPVTKKYALHVRQVRQDFKMSSRTLLLNSIKCRAASQKSPVELRSFLYCGLAQFRVFYAATDVGGPEIVIHVLTLHISPVRYLSLFSITFYKFSYSWKSWSLLIDHISMNYFLHIHKWLLLKGIAQDIYCPIWRLYHFINHFAIDF